MLVYTMDACQKSRLAQDHKIKNKINTEIDRQPVELKKQCHVFSWAAELRININ